MDGDKSVKAVFVKKEYPLEVTVQGEGIVEQIIVTGKGTNYKHGTTVRLSALPNTGWRFEKWEGDLSDSTNPATIVIDSAKSVKAVFKACQINVPQDYASIQEAIDAAQEGYLILVSPGTYKENLNLNGKNNLTLTSTNPLDPLVVEATIINGNQKGACIIAENGENDIVISGFTITNGSGKLREDNLTTGGGIYTKSASLTIQNCTISGNKASASGGIYAYSSTINITNSNISQNTTLASSGHGGGIFAESSSTINILKSIISKNIAKGSGGAIDAFSATVTIQESTIFANEAFSGGGIYIQSPSTLTIKDTNINNNRAKYGGAIISFGSNLTLTTSNINANTAELEGGGFYVNSSNLTINQCTINDNSTTIYQGGGFLLCNKSVTNIRESVINGNTAEFGSGIFVYDANANLTDCTISSNTALGFGGAGVCASVSSVVNITDCTISGNLASEKGGGGVLAISATVSITGSTISGNTASSAEEVSCGGGINVYNSSNLIFQNNTVKDNNAKTNGGGLWRSANSRITNLNGELLSTKEAVEAINEFANNNPDNVFLEQP